MGACEEREAAVVGGAFARAGFQHEDTGGGFEVFARYRQTSILVVNDGESVVPRTWLGNAMACFYRPDVYAGGVGWGRDEAILCVEMRARDVVAVAENSSAVLDAWGRCGSLPPRDADSAEFDALLPRIPLPLAVVLGSGIPVRITWLASGGALVLTYGSEAMRYADFLSREGHRFGGAFWAFYFPA